MIILEIDDRKLYNPTKKIVKQVLSEQDSVYYSMSLYLLKTRITSQIMKTLYSSREYKTESGGILILHKNMVYLTLKSPVKNLRDIHKLENIINSSIQEVLFHYRTYPEHIKMNVTFIKMLGKGWKKNNGYKIAQSLNNNK
jgi:hypothetical protein